MYVNYNYTSRLGVKLNSVALSDVSVLFSDRSEDRNLVPLLSEAAWMVLWPGLLRVIVVCRWI